MTGTFTAADGTPKEACVHETSWEEMWEGWCPDENRPTGRYRVSGLGPYAWPLFFDTGGGSQWSGNTGNRFKARTVKVIAGRTVTYNERQGSRVTVRGTVTAPVPFERARVEAFNTVTGDPIGDTSYVPGTPFKLLLPGNQTIALKYTYTVDPNSNESRSGWHGGGTDITRAAVVTVPATGSVTVDIAAP